MISVIRASMMHAKFFRLISRGFRPCNPGMHTISLSFISVEIAGSKPLLEQFGLLLHDLASLSDVLCENIAAKRNDGCVTNDPILKNRDIRCSTSDIDQCYTGFFFLLTQHRSRRSERFKDELIDVKIGFS